MVRKTGEESGFGDPSYKGIIVDLRINETLQPGAVRKPHLPGGESVYLFLEFTIVCGVGSQSNRLCYKRPVRSLDSEIPPTRASNAPSSSLICTDG